MANPKIKELEETLNTLLEEKRKRGISWIYVDELVKEARDKLGYPDDDFPKWKWQGIKQELTFQVIWSDKIDLSDFNLKESK